MNGKNLMLFTTLFFSALLFFSCASMKPAGQSLPPEQAVAAVPERPPEQAAAAIPERPPERPDPPDRIMGRGLVSEENLALFLERNNPEADREFALSLAGYYITEAALEGVNHDTAFAQMCLETGFLSYGGLVTPDMNNFCGLGSIGPGQSGETFPNPQTGVRAHIQHLKAYASEDPLNGLLVDPRYKWVRYGSSPTIHGLSGTWAADKSYSGKISAILRRLYDFSFSPER
ncbi:MAG: glucosaminidase domain-containing protein [Treponema sp.]|jgi:hypothetical protein|nr:glucosaminidase domain-containing protein [Treponema sp.]